MVKAADALTECQVMLVECENDMLLRLKATAFTRHRKLGAERPLHLLLQRIAAPLQLELDRYFASRERFWPILLEPDPNRRDRMLDRLVRDIAVRPESIRPDRHPPHKTPRNKHFHAAKKAVFP